MSYNATQQKDDIKLGKLSTMLSCYDSYDHSVDKDCPFMWHAVWSYRFGEKIKESHTGQGHVGKHQLNMGQRSKRGEWVCYWEEAEKKEENQEESGKEWEYSTCEGDDPTPGE